MYDTEFDRDLALITGSELPEERSISSKKKKKVSFSQELGDEKSEGEESEGDEEDQEDETDDELEMLGEDDGSDGDIENTFEDDESGEELEMMEGDEGSSEELYMTNLKGEGNGIKANSEEMFDDEVSLHISRLFVF